ncbi:15892_t:CDS:2 [Cetraspora pellucida]|uniref:15892_t:CDS:1 n=1 Tax=Cetraspora pellucida TaxID=1433469 RepID=A0A9N9F9F5_9GLOM|nr:15892_t:CDS:2 [Cetraspora pellucida]
MSNDKDTNSNNKTSNQINDLQRKCSDISINLQRRFSDVSECVVRRQPQSVFSLRAFSIIVLAITIIALCYNMDLLNISPTKHFGKHFMPAVDLPIFRNLVKITSLLSGQLAGLSITAPSDIMRCSFRSSSLAHKVAYNQHLFNDSVEMVKYLNDLSDKTFDLGQAIEKMYPTGEFTLRVLGKELSFIVDQIQPDQVLTQKNIVFFEIRYRMILKVVTDLRDRFQKVMKELDEVYIAYSGRKYQLKHGMNDIETFFNRIAPILDPLYDTERITRDLAYLKRIMGQIPNIRNQISYLLFEFNQHRQVLIWYCNEWDQLQRRKLVTLEDIEDLVFMSNRLDSIADIFKRKIDENTDLVIRIPNLSQN